MRRKGFCDKESLAVRQSMYSLDSKRLSHEGLISGASQFCRIKQQCERKIEQENKQTKKALKWAYSTVCSCCWEWFLWASVWERWVFLSLWVFSMLFISYPLNSHSRSSAASAWDGNLSAGRCCLGVIPQAEGWTWWSPTSRWTDGLPPSNMGTRCAFREHNIRCEHPSLRKRELDLRLHTCVAVLEFAGEQQNPCLKSCLCPSAPHAAGDRFVQSWLWIQFLNNVPWLLTIKLNMINYPIVSPKLLLYFCAFFFPAHQFK